MNSDRSLSLRLSEEMVEEIIVRVAERVLTELRGETQTEPASPYMTIPEAAEYLRCRRQRVDDLLSQRRLTRFKEGRRTLLSRTELEEMLGGA